MGGTMVLGVTGGIAAYKAADLCSKLAQADYDVHVIMTENACKLVAPLTFMTLSRHPVTTGLFELSEWRPGHVALAAADFAVIAPATANIIGKMAHGIADDALSTFLITFRKPVILAPAMNPDMFMAPAVQENLEILKKRGVILVGPEEGHVACGSPGPGRMAKIESILAAVARQ